MTDVEKLQANTATAVKTLSPLSGVATFGFNRDSVAWVEGYIERQRIGMSPEVREGIVSVLGSFLGECIIHCHGGKWRRDEVGWGIFFDERLTAYPFSKVRKQFDNGVKDGDSILSFFDTTGVLFKAHITVKNSRKPWWKFW